jgi:hypothetical protein
LFSPVPLAFCGCDTDSYKLFEEEISQMYKNLEDSTTSHTENPLNLNSFEDGIKKLIQDRLTWKIPSGDWNNESDLFELGMDSLQALQLRRLILASIPKSDDDSEQLSKRIPREFVYQNPSVSKMASALRRGGIFIASECYFGAMRASCTRAFAELWRGLYAALPNADYEWPVSLPATLQAAGLAAVEARGDVGLVRGATPEAAILRLSVEAMRGRMPDDVDIEAGLRVLDDPTSFEPGIIWYTAWGKR